MILRNGVKANARQLRKAADLLREGEAEPSAWEERPGFIEASKAEDILVFSIGILPSTTYRINREGALVDE